MNSTRSPKPGWVSRDPHSPPMREARHSTGPGCQGGQTNSGALTAAPPLVVETANRAGLSDVHPPQGPRGARAAPNAAQTLTRGTSRALPDLVCVQKTTGAHPLHVWASLGGQNPLKWGGTLHVSGPRGPYTPGGPDIGQRDIKGSPGPSLCPGNNWCTPFACLGLPRWPKPVEMGVNVTRFRPKGALHNPHDRPTHAWRHSTVPGDDGPQVGSVVHTVASPVAVETAKNR